MPPWQASTQWHHCTYSVKYGWCDAHSPCVGGVICQEIPPGNYLLLFFASARRCGLPFSTARAKIAQPPPWIWRDGATHQTEGELFFLLHLSPECPIHQEEMEQHGNTSHISFGMLCFRAHPLGRSRHQGQ